MSWAQLAAILSVLTAMLGALLVLGSHVVADGAPERGRLLWLGFVTATLAGALGAGVLALLLNSVS
jgi:hypothetical protein